MRTSAQMCGTDAVFYRPSELTPVSGHEVARSFFSEIVEVDFHASISGRPPGFAGEATAV